MASKAESFSADELLRQLALARWSYPVPEDYAERLLRAAGCKGVILLGWRSGVGPRCRMCGVTAPIPTARMWEVLREWSIRQERQGNG